MQGHQDTQVVAPSATPWFSDDEDLSPRASRYYNDLFALYTQRQPAGAASTNNHPAAAQAAHARKASTATTFPGSVAQHTELRKANGVQRPPGQDKTMSALSHSFLTKHYQKAKAIYKNGPPGEAEMFWEGWKSYRQAKRGAVKEICTTKRPKVASRPSHLDSAATCGGISDTSCEVPIKLHHTVLTIDNNRPLPPAPTLHNVPLKRAQKGKGKMLDVNKPLPRTPLPWPDTLDAGDASPVDAPWSIHHTQTGDSDSLAHGPQSIVTKPLPPIPPSTGKSRLDKEEKARVALKAKISRPILVPSPTYPSVCLPDTDGDALGQEAKDKQNIASTKKRPDSDASFGCLGVMQDESLEPRPLFSGSSDDLQRVDSFLTGRWI